MSVIRLTFQDGRPDEEHAMGDGQLLLTLTPSGGIASGDYYAGGTYSASELKSVELPDWVPIAPAVTQPPKLVEREYDLSAYSTDGVRVGPELKFKTMSHADPEPAAKTKQKPKEAA